MILPDLIINTCLFAENTSSKTFLFRRNWKHFWHYRNLLKYFFDSKENLFRLFLTKFFYYVFEQIYLFFSCSYRIPNFK